MHISLQDMAACSLKGGIMHQAGRGQLEHVAMTALAVTSATDLAELTQQLMTLIRS